MTPMDPSRKKGSIQPSQTIGRIHATIKAHRPDIIVLTEFRENPPGFCLRDALSTDGLIFQATSLPPPKKNGVLIAARAVQTTR